MRTLLLLRGAPGCGKTTWIKENGLEHYTLSSDDIRIMYQSPVMGTDGQTKISQANDDAVWKTLLRILRGRMQRGDFTVIDATNARTSELNRYKELCAEYRYRVYCVDFTTVPIEEVKRRNAGREDFRKVPERVIDTMYSRFATQKVPSGIKVIRPDELDTVWLAKRDFSHYKSIHHIGDIHGCNTALQEYLAAEGGMKEDELYIFVGDYIDRGCENAEVVNFLLSIMDRKNVLLLEGNHEKNLWLWASEQETADREFELVTKPVIEKAGIDRKEVRNLYRRFAQCAYYDYDGNTYLVTHAGLSAIPDNLSYVATEQMIMGVGKYEDVEDVAEAFRKNMPENCFQIYGHRNLKQVPLTAEGRVFNLEGQIEYGGFLRCLKITHDGIRPTVIRNRVFRTPEEREEQNRFAESSVADLLISMRHNKYIMERKYGNLSSFNFTDEAFYDKAWDSQTVRARGLYLDTVKGKVAARAYDKFFNIGEREETRMDRLQRRLHFPVTAYVKENGYLGIVSYDEKEDDLLVACKFTLDSLFVERLKEMLAAKVSKTHLEEMKDYIKENDVSFIFECVDMEHDPHVIEYQESRLVLLDIVKNSMETARYEYGQMCAVAERFGLLHKEKACELPDWQTFFDWYHEIRREDYEYRGQKIEGFVIEDSGGYMVKVKLHYYQFWKQMRAVAKEVSKKGFIANTAMLTTPVANEFYGWLREKYDTGELKKLPKDICSLRKRFLDSKG